MNPRLRAILVDDARRALDRRKQALAAATSGRDENGAQDVVAVAEYVKRSLRHRPWLVHRKTRR
jgi:hypothetical protein